GAVVIKNGKLFIRDGVVHVHRIGEAKAAADVGTVTVKDGKPVAVTGKLTLQDGKVQGPEDALVLQPDEYTVSAHKVGIWWQAIPYLIITVAEILISVTGLELAFVAAPKAMKSFVTGMWLLAVGLANLFINAPVTRLYTEMSPTTYFGGLAVTLL